MKNLNSEDKEIENCKFMVGRIDLLHDSLIEDIRIRQGRISDINKDLISSMRGKRNNLLTAFGITLTIILGIQSINSDNNFWSFFSMFTILGLGLVVFVIYNYYVWKIEDVFSQFEIVLYEAEGMINKSKGFFIGETKNIELLDYVFLENYYTFTTILGGLVWIPLIKAVHNIQKTKHFDPRIKEDLLKHAKIVMSDMTDLPSHYQRVDTKQKLSSNVLKFVKNNFEEFNKIQKSYSVNEKEN